jgi:hypothetical protein
MSSLQMKIDGAAGRGGAVTPDSAFDNNYFGA